jgi:negative regulator of flagellin synthesis FlgM
MLTVRRYLSPIGKENTCIILKFFATLSITVTDKNTKEFDMTIESITGGSQIVFAPKKKQKTEIDSEKNESVKGIEKSDSVEITAMAQRIKKAFESSSSATIIDTDRVAAVKKSLDDGSYKINAERIAEKMIQYEKLMP